MSDERTARLQRLRDAALRRPLAPSEQRELDALLAEADAEEEGALAPANARLDHAIAERGEVLAGIRQAASELERVVATRRPEPRRKTIAR